MSLVPERYAVIGNPIAHSQSPRIHAAFAQQTGQCLIYERILGDTESFAVQVREFFNAGGRGLNVTLPFKVAAWQLANHCSGRAAIAEAANTLVYNGDGTIFADNTDGPGIVRDLVCNYGVHFSEMSILLIGAGGAARGVIYALLEQKPRSLFVVNRTAIKAHALVAKLLAYSAFNSSIRAGGLENIDGLCFDLVINATSASINGVVPVLPDGCVKSGGIVYDMFYSTQLTAFMQWGIEQGASLVVDGLGMLVEQAAESFLLWRGVRPDTGVVLKMLRT